MLQYTPHQWFMMQSMSEVVRNVRKQLVRLTSVGKKLRYVKWSISVNTGNIALLKSEAMSEGLHSPSVVTCQLQGSQSLLHILLFCLSNFERDHHLNINVIL